MLHQRQLVADLDLQSLLQMYRLLPQDQQEVDLLFAMLSVGGRSAVPANLFALDTLLQLGCVSLSRFLLWRLLLLQGRDSLALQAENLAELLFLGLCVLKLHL